MSIDNPYKIESPYTKMNTNAVTEKLCDFDKVSVLSLDVMN